MKFFYAISILAQLLLAVPSGNRNKISYLLYLWGSLFNQHGSPLKNKVNSNMISPAGRSRPKTDGDKYSLFLER